MKMSVSKVFSETRSEAKRIVRIKSPWLERNPVRSTMPTAPPPGGGGMRFELPSLLVAVVECWRSLVPPSRMLVRCCFKSSIVEEGSPRQSRGSFCRGVDSPVSADSLTVTEPCRAAGRKVRRRAGMRGCAQQHHAQAGGKSSGTRLQQHHVSGADCLHAVAVDGRWGPAKCDQIAGKNRLRREPGLPPAAAEYIYGGGRRGESTHILCVAKAGLYYCAFKEDEHSEREEGVVPVVVEGPQRDADYLRRCGEGGTARWWAARIAGRAHAGRMTCHLLMAHLEEKKRCKRVLSQQFGEGARGDLEGVRAVRVLREQQRFVMQAS